MWTLIGVSAAVFVVLFAIFTGKFLSFSSKPYPKPHPDERERLMASQDKNRKRSSI